MSGSVLANRSHSPFAKCDRHGGNKRHRHPPSDNETACDHARSAQTLARASRACLTLSPGLGLDFSPTTNRDDAQTKYLGTYHSTGVNTFSTSWRVDVAHILSSQVKDTLHTSGTSRRQQRSLETQWRILQLITKTIRGRRRKERPPIQI